MTDEVERQHRADGERHRGYEGRQANIEPSQQSRQRSHPCCIIPLLATGRTRTATTITIDGGDSPKVG